MQTLVDYSWLIPLLPLIGAAVSGFAGARWLRGQSHWPIWAGVGASAVLSLLILFTMMGEEPNHTLPERAAAGHQETHERAAEPQALELDGASELHDAEHGPDRHVKAWSARWYTWIAAGDPSAGAEAAHPVPGDKKTYTRDTADEAGLAMIKVEESTYESGYLEVAAGAFLDPLTAVMLCVVCGIGFLITVFAAGYMKGEEGYWRFFAYLGLFIFAMTILVMGDNLVMLYLGWEGVGLCSYLLIGHYYQRPAARDAARKAFIVNRIGDFGFAIGIMLIFYCFGTVSYFGHGPGSASPGFVEMFTNWRAYVPEDRWSLVPVIPRSEEHTSE